MCVAVMEGEIPMQFVIFKYFIYTRYYQENYQQTLENCMREQHII